MGTENTRMNTTIQALEDLNSGHQYHAIALVDGKLANSGEEASGILLNKPKSAEFAALGYIGELKFAAGLAISKGSKLTVTTSGWLTTADSNDPIVGEAKAAVTSGSVGTGLFAFPTATDKAMYFPFEVTPTVNVLAGTGYSLDDNKCADNGEECDGVAITALSSGVAGNIAITGVIGVRYADVTSAGDQLSVTGSGYFSILSSGYYGVGKCLANVASGLVGDALITPGFDYTGV